MEDKAALRRYWKERLLGQASGDAGLTPVLAALAANFDVVLGTLPLPGEPDLTVFYDDWLARGGTLGLARTRDQGQMDFGLVSALEQARPARLGLREPLASSPAWVPGPRTLVLVPGLAFAGVRGGFIRLGRGGGYFDRWLEANRRSVTTLGVGFPFQLVNTLPRERHDLPLDGFADSAGVHRPDSL